MLYISVLLYINFLLMICFQILDITLCLYTVLKHLSFIYQIVV